MSNPATEERGCPHCDGTGRLPAIKKVTPWASWQERAELARRAKAGDRWIQIKSGRVAVVQGPINEFSCIHLKHENGRTTSKWHNYFAQEFTPESPPNE